MIAIYIGLYILVLLFLWGFFFLARHHAYKFRAFSTNIVPITQILLVFILFLSVAGIFIILQLSKSDFNISLPTKQSQKSEDTSVNYQKYY